MRTSLQRHVPDPPATENELRARAAAVWRGGRGVMFFADQLGAMTWAARELIEAEARRLYGERNGGGKHG